MDGQAGHVDSGRIDGSEDPFLSPSDILGAALQRLTVVIRPSTYRRESRVEMEKRASHRRTDELLAIVSHELRSPLASMHYAMHVLNGLSGNSPAREQMQALIQRQLGHMTRLVDDLLDASRVANGSMQLQRSRIDLRVVVEHAIETVTPQVEARSHELTVALPDEPVWLMADPFRLEQVFVNLLANAARYTDHGGRVAAWVHAREGQALIRIRDSGVGMAPQLLTKVFDLFRQADAADPHSRSGLGIGLAVVRSIVELHGGSVTAASRGCGHGSEFTVCLPRED